MYIPPLLSPRGPKMSSTLRPPRGAEGGGTTLVEAMEFGLMMSLTGWFGPACLYTFKRWKEILSV